MIRQLARFVDGTGSPGKLDYSRVSKYQNVAQSSIERVQHIYSPILLLTLMYEIIFEVLYAGYER